MGRNEGRERVCGRARVAEENPERVGKMECKFYSLPGGCRYGNACKFVHCPEKTDKGQTEKTGKGQTGSHTIRFPIRPDPTASAPSSPKGTVKHSRAPTLSEAAGTTNQEGNTEEQPDSAFRFNLLNSYLTSTPTVTVSPVGLPLRPDQPVCKYYSRFGLCKFGIGCQFDHPVNYGSLIAKSSDQAPTSNNTCRNGSQ